MQPDNIVAIATKNYHKYSETFIHDCVRYWPGKIAWLYGDYYPQHCRLGENGPEINFRKADAPYNIAGGLTAANDLKTLRDFLHDLKPQAMLAHYGPTGVSLMDVCKQLHIPLYVHFHGYDAYRSDILTSYGRQYPKLFKVAKGLIVVSQAMHSQLRKLGAPAKKLHLVHYGVEVAGVAQKPLPASPVFSFAGRFTEKKFPSHVIRAFKEVSLELPDARLVMAGDGELFNQCRMLTSELGLTDKVSFTGILSRRSVTDLLLNSTALVLPSGTTEQGDSEGCPLVILEAGAASRAVIATRHAGIPEVIDHGLNGILTEPGDINALAEGMLMLGKNPQLAEKMGNCARTKIEAEFRRTDYINQLSSLVYGRSTTGVARKIETKILTT
ncbi:MAG TPA: glycosyltransferase [Chitinophagaceae bacterium]